MSWAWVSTPSWRRISLPSRNSTNVGKPFTARDSTRTGLASQSALPTLSRPSYAEAAQAITGAIKRQGPHQLAQTSKSIGPGCSATSSL